MLLNEVADVIDIQSKLKKRQENDERKALAQRSKERLAKLKARTKEHKPKDELGAKRRAKLSTADKFRDIARQFRSDDKE